MIKYDVLNIKKIMFDFTNSNKIKKRNPDKNGKNFESKSLLNSNFIRSIIQRFNYFDILVALIILAGLCFLLYNRLQRKSTWINVRISVENIDWWYKGSPPELWYATDLKPGDTAKDSFGNDAAKVINVENYDAGGS